MKIEFAAHVADTEAQRPTYDPLLELTLLGLDIWDSDGKLAAQSALKERLARSPGALSRHFQDIYQAYFPSLGLEAALPEMESLPYASWAIGMNFQLRKPYLSRDDTELYPIDNPLRKDWVFKLPFIAPSQWKGALYSALWNQGQQRKTNPAMQKLFGNIREEKDAGQRGRLYCYPTFFTQMGAEMINPHERKGGSGTVPITFECVPAGAWGCFQLLYIPFDLLGQPPAAILQESLGDLALAASGVQALLTESGFGAKTSSGFGVTEDRIRDGLILLNSPDKGQKQSKTASAPPQMPETVRAFFQDYPNEDFSLRPKEWRERSKATNRQREAYAEARAEQRDYQELLTAYQQTQAEAEAQAQVEPPAVTRRAFSRLSELAQIAGGLAGEEAA